MRGVEGGFDAFRRSVLTAPAAPTETTPEALSDYLLRSALYARFTGAKARVEAPVPTVAPVKRATKKGGGC